MFSNSPLYSETSSNYYSSILKLYQWQKPRVLKFSLFEKSARNSCWC